MHLERDGGVPAGDVLAEEFAADGFAFGTAECVWVVGCLDVEVAVVSWMDLDIASSRVTEERPILDDVDVDVGNRSRVFRWIRGVDLDSQIERRLCGVKNAQIDKFGVDPIGEISRQI